MLSFKKWLESTKVKRYTKDEKKRLKKASGKPGGPEWTGGVRIYTEDEAPERCCGRKPMKSFGPGLKWHKLCVKCKKHWPTSPPDWAEKDIQKRKKG
jgi:hypothetical protein